METTILTNMLNDYKNTTAGWGDVLFPFARQLFFLLATLEITWAALRIALHGENLPENIAYMTKLVIGIAFFYALLLNAATWIPALTDSFSQAGAKVSGLERLDPSAVLQQGLNITASISENMTLKAMIKSPIATFIAGWSQIIILIAFALIAGHLLMALIESFIVIGSGVLFLGFAGSSWTLLMTERYLAYALSTGVKLFMLYALMGVGSKLAAQWTLRIEQLGTFSPNVYFEIIGSAIIFAAIAWTVPRLAAGLMAGAVALAFSDLVMAGAAVGSLGSSAVTGTFSALSQVRGGGEATIEAAKFAGDVARSKGGGLTNAGRGVLSGGAALAKETLRQQWSGALVGSNNPAKGSVADRITQRRAEFREKQTANTSGGGKGSTDSGDTGKSTKSEANASATGDGTTADEKKGTA